MALVLAAFLGKDRPHRLLILLLARSSRTRRMPLAPQVALLAPEGIVAVDAVGRDDVDVDLLITCKHLECLCKASMADRLTSLIGKVLSRSEGGGVHGIDAVEVCGGGSRGPMLCNAIRYACGRDEGYFASRSFDDSLLAFGASLIGAIDVTIDEDNDNNDGALCRSRLREAQGRMMGRADAQRDRGPDPRIALGTLRPPQ